jgi:putative transcriptional regulator
LNIEIINKAMPVATTIEISTLIRTLRLRLGLSQRQFGEQLGVVFQTVNNWENGRTHPTRMALMVIQRQLEEMGEQGKDLLKQYLAIQESSVICDLCVKPVFL